MDETRALSDVDVPSMYVRLRDEGRSHGQALRLVARAFGITFGRAGAVVRSHDLRHPSELEEQAERLRLMYGRAHAPTPYDAPLPTRGGSAGVCGTCGGITPVAEQEGETRSYCSSPCRKAAKRVRRRARGLRR